VDDVSCDDGGDSSTMCWSGVGAVYTTDDVFSDAKAPQSELMRQLQNDHQ